MRVIQHCRRCALHQALITLFPPGHGRRRLLGQPRQDRLGEGIDECEQGLLHTVQTGQIAPHLIEGGGDALLGSILPAVELLLNGMSNQCSGGCEALLLNCFVNVSMSFVRKADGTLWHGASSLSKAWHLAFSDMLNKKICLTPKRDSHGLKRIPC